MGPKQTKEFDQINKMLEKSSSAIHDYWLRYSNLNTWQFWLLLVLLLLPLILLFLFIDRKKALLIGFFGWNIHVWFHYADLFTTTHGLTNFPYKLIPFLPVSVTLDTSLIPVSFMLLYQWTLNNNKNYYLYAAGLSTFLSFLVKPALVTFDLFRLYKGMNYLYIFLIYLLVACLSKWITNLFLQLQKHEGKKIGRHFKLTRFFSNNEKAK